jgi:hypothetical protein
MTCIGFALVDRVPQADRGPIIPILLAQSQRGESSVLANPGEDFCQAERPLS